MTFSVLVAIYKKENPAYFDEAMQSIWDYQVQKPGQIVLVMDGEVTAELNAVIMAWKSKLDDVLVVVALPQNIGLGGALNEGLKFCDHELVARMDADDICLPDRFSKQVAFFEKDSSLDIVGCFALEIDERGNREHSAACLSIMKILLLAYGQLHLFIQVLCLNEIKLSKWEPIILHCGAGRIMNFGFVVLLMD